MDNSKARKRSTRKPLSQGLQDLLLRKLKLRSNHRRICGNLNLSSPIANHAAIPRGIFQRKTAQHAGPRGLQRFLLKKTSQANALKCSGEKLRKRNKQRIAVRKCGSARHRKRVELDRRVSRNFSAFLGLNFNGHHQVEKPGFFFVVVSPQVFPAREARGGFPDP